MPTHELENFSSLDPWIKAVDRSERFLDVQAGTYVHCLVGNAGTSAI